MTVNDFESLSIGEAEMLTINQLSELQNDGTMGSILYLETLPINRLELLALG